MSTEISRYKVNQEAQAILVRHAVDLAKLSFSFTGQTLYLSGSLVPQPAGEFRGEDIRGLADDLARHPSIRNVQFDLDNWVVSFEFGVCEARPRVKEDRKKR